MSDFHEHARKAERCLKRLVRRCDAGSKRRKLREAVKTFRASLAALSESSESSSSSEEEEGMLLLEKRDDAEDPFVLTPTQQEHATIMARILDANGVGIDPSGYGLGKTVTAAAIGKEHYDAVLVTCPAGPLQVTWMDTMRKQGTAVVEVETWTALAGQVHKQPRNTWITRTDVEEERAVASGDSSDDEEQDNKRKHIVTTFEPTPKLIKLMRERKILVILDEVHYAKNEGPRCKAITGLLHLVFDPVTGTRRRNSKSAVLMQSGSLLDKPEHAIPMLQMAAFLPHVIDRKHPLFKPVKHGETVIPLGSAQTFHDRCMDLNRQKTMEHHDRFLVYRRKLRSLVPNSQTTMSIRERGRQYIYCVFRDVVLPVLGHAMPCLVYEHLDVKNGFYRIGSQEEENAFSKAVQNFRRTQLSAQNNQKARMGELQQRCKEVDTAKVPALIRTVKQQLARDPHCKMVVSLNFTDNVDTVMAALQAEYKPMKMTGQPSLSAEQKNAICTRFRAAEYVDGTLQDRVIVAIATVIGVGLSLHSTREANSVYCWAFPSYHGQTMHQLPGRFTRFGVKGKVVFRYFFGRLANGNNHKACLEARIIRSLAGKSVCMKEMAQAQVQGGVLYAEDLPQEQEEDFEGTMIDIGKVKSADRYDAEEMHEALSLHQRSFKRQASSSSDDDDEVVEVKRARKEPLPVGQLIMLRAPKE